MIDRVVVLELARVEAVQLSALIAQFAELMDAPVTADPAVRRLVPDTYDDEADAREFRELTEGDLLARRGADAAIVLQTLAAASAVPDDPDDAALLESTEITLDAAQSGAWLRTLAAVRLVLATRLGVEAGADYDDEDPRFGIYEWLGYRLDGLVQAIDRDD